MRRFPIPSRDKVPHESTGSNVGSASLTGARPRREPPAARGVDSRCIQAHVEQDHARRGGRKVETAVEARAGFLDRPVLLVLCASLTLGVVILGALWLGFFHAGT